MQLVQMVNNGIHPVVEFSPRIIDLEGYFDVNMRARVTSAYEDESNDFIVVVFDVTDFNDYNSTFEVHNYYTLDGRAELTATEAGFNPLTRKGGNGLEAYYFAIEDDVVYFNIIETETNSLYSEYLTGKSTDSYVQWLEAQLIKSRNDVRYMYEQAAGASI